MPELLLARIIAVSSNPGDLVLDPFSGSGTTAAVACQLERRYTGIDISKNYVVNSIERIRKIRRSEIKSADNGPLTAASGLS